VIVEYMVRDNKPIIHILYTDEQGIKHHEEVGDFVPYFYVPIDEVIPNDERIIKVEDGEFYSLLGGKVKKIYAQLPSQVKELREKFKKTYEADVLFPTRYTIDKIDEIKGKLRNITLDIEVDDSEGMPDVKKANMSILSCGLHDSLTDTYFALYWRRDLKEGVEEKYFEGHKVIHVKRSNEKDFLYELIATVRRINPEVITVWNFKRGLGGFDIPYILRRMENLGVDNNLLSPLEYVDAEREKIHGVAIFDLLAGYKKMMLKEMRNYKLDYVAEVELGKRKMSHDESIYEMWQGDLDRLIDYNITDVILTVGINKKRNVLGLYDEIRRLTKVDLTRVLNYSVDVDCALLSYCRGRFVLPTKKKITKKKKIKGAIVLEPEKGLHRNVIVCDLTRSYPSAMITCNLSPETFNLQGDIIIEKNLIFNSTPKGVIPSVLDSLINLRKEKKKLMKGYEYGSEEYNIYYTQQFALKSLINSFYGVTAFEDFRLYDQRVASATTNVGRKLINWCAKIAKDNGYKVIYGDTDSLFIEVDSYDLDKVVEKGYELKAKIVESFDSFALSLGATKHVFDLDFEKVFSAIFFTEAKKRYAGKLAWLEGKRTDKMKIVGFDSVRSDTTKVSKKIQENLFVLITSGKSLKAIKEESYDYLREEIEKIRGGKYNLSDLAFPSSIQKPIEEYKVMVPAVRAIHNASFIGKTYKPGDKALLVPLSKSPRGMPPMDVIMIDDEKDLPKGFEIDYDTIIDKSIRMKVEDILPSMGLTFEEVVTGRKQSTLW